MKIRILQTPISVQILQEYIVRSDAWQVLAVCALIVASVYQQSFLSITVIAQLSSVAR